MHTVTQLPVKLAVIIYPLTGTSHPMTRIRYLILSLLLPTDGNVQVFPSCLLALYDEQLYVRPNIH